MHTCIRMHARTRRCRAAWAPPAPRHPPAPASRSTPRAPRPTVGPLRPPWMAAWRRAVSIEAATVGAPSGQQRHRTARGGGREALPRPRPRPMTIQHAGAEWFRLPALDRLCMCRVWGSRSQCKGTRVWLDLRADLRCVWIARIARLRPLTCARPMSEVCGCRRV